MKRNLYRTTALLLALLLLLAGCSPSQGESPSPEEPVSSEEDLQAPQAPPQLAEDESSQEESEAEIPLEKPDITLEEAVDLIKPEGDGVWSISTPRELCAFALLVNEKDTDAMAATVELVSSLNMSGINFVPIGAQGVGFIGRFDGGGNTISGLTVLSEEDDVGLFGTLGIGGVVDDVHITGGRVYGNNQVGGIVGNNGGTVTTCSFRGTVEGAGSSVGGICGLVRGVNEYKDFSSSAESSPGESGETDETEASSQEDVPPIPGGDDGFDQPAGKVIQCVSNAEVRGHSHVGGLAGDINGQALVQDCYALGSVTAIPSKASGETPNSIGGFCGVVNGSISRCYASAEVYTEASSKIVGGFIGLIDSGDVSSCYFNQKPVENWKDVGYIMGSEEETHPGVTACTVEEITEQSTFAGWDFAGVWDIYENQNRGLPFLRAITQRQ